MAKTVIVVEDDRGLREQLVRVLNSKPGIGCIGACASGEEALRVIPTKTPDVVLMDIRLPGMSGIDCVAELRRRYPGLQMLMLTVYEDSESIFRALKAGACGYLVKSSPPLSLLEAIQDAAKGGAALSSSVARRIRHHFQHPAAVQEVPEQLAQREDEVLELLAGGYTYQEIGAKLGLEIEKVRANVKAVCEKLRAGGGG